MLDGFEPSIEEKDGKVYSATCTIYRKDWSRPFKKTVYFDELAKYKDEWIGGKKTGNKVLTEFWDKMQRSQLEKCSVVDAFRIGFAGNQELEGLHYITEESEDRMIVVTSNPGNKSETDQ